MVSPVEVSIIVVSYNTKAMTLACLASVRAETRASFELIVVDNASSDGSAEAIAAADPEAVIIPSRENLGFARANNLAARRARGRYILLLNPDTLVHEGAIDRLLAFAKARPAARIWGGRTTFGDGRLNPASAWGEMTVWNLFCRAAGLTGLFPRTTLFNGEALGGWDRASERDVDIVSGCFFLIERAFWQQLGGFDSAFFMYGEEADLCLRARELGARPRVTPEATIVHYGGASETAREAKLVKLLAAKSMLIRRHWPRGRRLVGLALLSAWPLTRALATAIAIPLNAGAWRACREWRAVWRARARWLNGFPIMTSQASLRVTARPGTGGAP
ncbi:MAG TPA: glycosyltransferase family 2 protein [Hyphomicrobiaceae bacterium]|nr:glycosyltransferase family 2 protein [Hyphomicrobiaceae bacterium]